MKIIVAGAKGFLGKHILEHYHSKPGFFVTGLSRSDCDLADADALKHYLLQEEPDVLIHSAVKVDDIANNIALYQAIEASAHLCGKVIFLGSGAEYNPQAYKPLMPESYFGNSVPQDSYSLSKYLISKLAETGPSNISVLRLFGIFGQYEDYRRRFISNNLALYLNGETLRMNKDIQFDFIYVKDFLRALDLYICASNNHKHYNLCTGQPIHFSHILREMTAVLGLNSDDFEILDPSPTQYQYSGDPTRFREEFGPFELTPIPVAIQEMYDYFLKEPPMLA